MSFCIILLLVLKGVLINSYIFEKVKTKIYEPFIHYNTIFLYVFYPLHT